MNLRAKTVLSQRVKKQRWVMTQIDERVHYYGPWRKRLSRLSLAACCGSFLFVTTTPAPAAANGMLVPICTNGAITYIMMSFGDENDTPPPEGPTAACHGPCLHERKRPAATADKLTL